MTKQEKQAAIEEQKAGLTREAAFSYLQSVCDAYVATLTQMRITAPMAVDAVEVVLAASLAKLMEGERHDD